jgi:hypothetical protein
MTGWEWKWDGGRGGIGGRKRALGCRRKRGIDVFGGNSLESHTVFNFLWV